MATEVETYTSGRIGSPTDGVSTGAGWRGSRACVNEQIEALLARNRQTGYGPLYDLLADYPFREGKGLRPAICLSAARAARGHTDQAACSAAALELFHNAFLLHDDVEDASDFRRGRITMLKHKALP